MRDRLYWLAAGVFVASLLTRTVWLSHAYFHPDESTVLWMALDAVRHPTLPDHGLVSHYQAFQPPGLVWVTAPFVALGDGRPEVVIVGFGLLNAGACAFLVFTVARFWSIVQAVVISAFLVVGPDAPISRWIWHPSLYTAAVALLLAAGIRLRSVSPRWAGVVVAIPGLYALIHYSGLALFGPALVLLLLSRRRLAELAVPAVAGAAFTLLAWVPFLLFENRRRWVDFSAIAHSNDAQLSFFGRVATFPYAAGHLGGGVYSRVHLTPLILAGALGAVVFAARRRSTDPAVLAPTLMLVTGFVSQVMTNQGRRTDMLMLWLPLLYVLCGWTVARVCDVVSARVRATSGDTVRLSITATAIAVVLAVGGIDLHRDITGTPVANTLAYQLNLARHDSPVHYVASHADSLYLPCDPPYDWGSETWYLEERAHPGTGIQAATRAGAFAVRNGTCASRR